MTEPADIGAIFDDGVSISAALAKAAVAAQREARALGRPLIVWQDGHVVEVPAELFPDALPAGLPIPVAPQDR